MAKLRVHNFSISLDGYGAGPGQSLADPIGAGGRWLHEWVFRTRSGHRMLGEPGGEEGLDEDFIVRGETGIGATIMGRNMFGPYRGAWADEEWTGWWGEEPPYHHDVFVLTNHPRPSIPMKGGTVFHFVDGGIELALSRAFDAAGGLDVRLGGGVSTIQQYLRAGLVDELNLAISPVLLGAGERLFDGLGPDRVSGFECVEFVASASASHVTLVRASGPQ